MQTPIATLAVALREEVVLVSCWSVKGGTGTTVVASGVALLLARRESRPVLLVDLAGDAPAVLGEPDPKGPGLAEWLRAGDDVPADGLARLECTVVPGLNLLPRGRGPLGGERAELLLDLLAADGRAVVVDCGRLDPSVAEPGTGADGLRLEAALRATHSLLVTRACYVALRRASASPVRPSGVVLVSEPGRALERADVEEIIGVPVLAEVPVEPAIARAVDAGLLSSRLPRALERALRDAA